jgi:hypothetical protein
VVFYFYSEGRVSLHIKALSALPILKDDFVFMSISGPSQNIIDSFQLKKLPTIAGLLRPSPESPDNIRQFGYGGTINFEEILSNLL